MPRPPRFAGPGSTVGVIAPSSPFPPERFAAGVTALESLGYHVRVHPNAYAQDGYLAGADALRIDAIHTFLDDPDVDVLWAARGGYGVHRIVDRVDVHKLAAARKPIVGFSDICALHALAQAKADLVSIHGPVVTQLGDLGAEAAAHTARVIAGDWADLIYEGTPLRSGRARGPLLGGCLSVIAPMIGSPYLPAFDGAILLLEDVGEATYRIDRLLTHLALAGVLGRVAGIALGDFAGCSPRNEREPTVEVVLAERLGDLGVPVLQGLPFGHGRKNLAVPLGATVELDAERGRLMVLPT